MDKFIIFIYLDILNKKGCGDGGVYTRTSFYYYWILSNIRKSVYVLKDRFIRINDFLPFGTSNGDSILARADHSTFLISLNNNYNFYDTPYDYIYVSTNGYISINDVSWTSISSFSNLDSPLVAGLVVDLDTRYMGDIFYRETSDPLILDSLRSYIIAYKSSKNASSLLLNSAFIVTYDNVPFYGYSSTNNSFQIIITASPDCETFAIDIYKYLNTGRTSYHAGFSSKSGILFKKLENDDLLYLVNYPALTMPSYIVYKLSDDNAVFTCSTTQLTASSSSSMTTSEYQIIDIFIKVNELLPYGTSRTETLY